MHIDAANLAKELAGLAPGRSQKTPQHSHSIRLAYYPRFWGRTLRDGGFKKKAIRGFYGTLMLVVSIETDLSVRHAILI